MEQHIQDLQLENAEKDTQIAALQAQLKPPLPPPSEDDDDEGGDDDARDGASLAQDEEEEEDPKEVIHNISSYEEDTPAMNTRGRKRKCMNLRDYIKRFKMWLVGLPSILRIVMRVLIVSFVSCWTRLSMENLIIPIS